MELKWSQMEPTGAKPKQNQRKTMKKQAFQSRVCCLAVLCSLFPPPVRLSICLPARLSARLATSPRAGRSAGLPVCSVAWLAGHRSFCRPPVVPSLSNLYRSLARALVLSRALSLSLSLSFFLSLSISIYIYIYMYIYIYIYTHIYI